MHSIGPVEQSHIARPVDKPKDDDVMVEQFIEVGHFINLLDFSNHLQYAA